MVRAAETLRGEILWLSCRPPSEVVGHLIEDVRGAWYEGDHIVINLDGNPQRFACPEGDGAPSCVERLAASVTELWRQELAVDFPSSQVIPALQSDINLRAA